MILRCPSCSAQFLVANTAIGPTGRKVRCSSCNHVWFAEPPTQRSAPQVMAPEPPVERRRGGDRGGGPTGHSAESRRPPNINLPATRQPQRSGRALVAGWLGLLLLVGGIAAGGYFARNEIVAFWPPAKQLYETLGIGTAEIALDSFPPGLDFANLRPEYAVVDGKVVLLLRGEITNAGTEPIDAPSLEVSLTGAHDEPLESWVIAVAETAIEPGGSIGFETRRVDPSEEAVHLWLRVAAHEPGTAGTPDGQAPSPPSEAHPAPEEAHGAASPGLDFRQDGHAPDEHAPEAHVPEAHAEDQEHAPAHAPSH